MDVGCAGVVGVADEQIQVADYRRLGGEVANVGGRVVFAGYAFETEPAFQFDGTVATSSDALNETLELSGGDVSRCDDTSISDRYVVKGVSHRIGLDSDDGGAFSSGLDRTASVVQEELAREGRREIQNCLG